MLMITRKIGESIIINGNIEIILCRIDRSIVRMAVNAPKGIRVNRKENEEAYLRRLAEETQDEALNMRT